MFVLFITSGLELAALMSSPALARQIPGGPYALLGALFVFFNSTSQGSNFRNGLHVCLREDSLDLALF